MLPITAFLIYSVVSPFVWNSNLFGRILPDYFQIDCNLGFPAAVMEMLLQEENGILYPLPALPEKWEKGRIRGMLCRGGHSMDLEWEKRRISMIQFCANYAGMVKISIPSEIKTVEAYSCQGVLKDGFLELECKEDGVYRLRFTKSMISITRL